MQKVILLSILFLLQICHAWKSHELQMFDLVEELQMSFYDFLGVEQTASPNEIKKAYRKMTLIHHPDKNPGNAEHAVKFRQLAGIYSVLKDEETRKQYDDVLEFGLPDWREPVFYYRQLRKMTSIELIVGICLILIGIHFSAIWGIAYEKRWAFEDQLSNTYKRHKFHGKKLEAINAQIKDDLKVVPLPGFFDILPFAIIRWVVALLTAIPVLITSALSMFKSKGDGAQSLSRKSEKLPPKKSKEIKERNNMKESPRKQIKAVAINLRACMDLENVEVENKDTISQWSEEDKQELITLINTTPASAKKWEKIASLLKKPLKEIMDVSRGLYEQRKAVLQNIGAKDSNFSDGFDVNENSQCYDSDGEVEREPLNEQDLDEEVEVNDQDTHVSHRHSKMKEEAENEEMKENDKLWSKQEHQKLEAALKIYTKTAPNRWESISDHIGSKTKEEVMLRCKLIATHCKRKNAKIFAL